MKSEHELASLDGISSIFKNHSSDSEIITFALNQLPAEKPAIINTVKNSAPTTEDKPRLF